MNKILNDFEDEYHEQDFYKNRRQQELIENDEISSEEAGFMMGYNQASAEEEE